YFHDYRKIIEIQSSANFIIKSKDKVELQLLNDERLRIARMSEEYSNTLILMKLLKGVEEPWEAK
ncbi:MAG: hypothetical protein DI598_10085, partial [Pseudopedobacter saltans]